MHEVFRPYLTSLRAQLSQGLTSSNVEDAVCEIGAHLELAYEEGIRHGCTHSEAYEKALLSLGLSSQELSKELEEQHERVLGLASSKAPLILSWIGSSFYALSLLLLPGYSQSLGLLFFPISTLPMFCYAMFMLSSYLHGRFKILGVAIPHLVFYGSLIAYLDIRMANLDFAMPYLVNITCLFVFGHLLMVLLRHQSYHRRERRRISG